MMIVQGRSPVGETAIIGRTTPLAGLIVDPKSTFSRMASRQHRHLAGWSNRIGMTFPLGSHYQFIGKVRHFQVDGRCRFVGVNTHVMNIVHTADHTQSVSVHPCITCNAMSIRCRSGEDGCDGRCLVHIHIVVLSILIDPALFHQSLKTAIAI